MTKQKLSIALIAAAALSACGPSTPRPEPGAALPMVRAGLERVLAQDARALQALFGAPDLDVREEGSRKLQFASGVCVLDAYLYPAAPGREPIVTYVDARLPNGEDVDRASCVAALSRRRQAR